MFQTIPLYLQNCGSLPFETFTFSLDGNGIPFEAEHVAFVAGRHATNDGEAMEPYYHGQSAAVSQIIFETTVGEWWYLMRICEISLQAPLTVLLRALWATLRVIVEKPPQPLLTGKLVLPSVRRPQAVRLGSLSTQTVWWLKATKEPKLLKVREESFFQKRWICQLEIFVDPPKCHGDKGLCR